MPEQKTFTSRFKHAWNAFFSRDPTKIDEYEDYRNDPYYGFYYGSHYRPDRPYLSTTSERTVVAAIYNRIAMDVAAIDIVHARLDDDERYIETIKSPLNNCLTVEANLDQTGRAFIQDVAMSMLDEGSVAIVPVDTSISPLKTGSYDIYTMRTGKVTEWRPRTVRVDVYNELVGRREEILLPKEMVSIIENPLYSVMNEPNSTLQRLLRKLRLLDFVDEQQASNKLNLIIQLPYVIKTGARQKQAEARSKAIEDQLTKSQYGIAYTDGTERITQLSRPIENNLQGQVEYLTKLLYSQLGLTEEIMNGSADDKAMINYYSRTIEPIVSAITDEMKRKFLTKTARTQGQTITFFRDPFRLVPISEIADIADRFTRNEILSSNEVRQIIGRKPSNDPAADELRNKNLYPVDTDGDGVPEYYQDQETGEQVDEAGNPIQNEDEEETDSVNGINLDGLSDTLDKFMDEYSGEDIDYEYELDDIDKQLDELEESLKHAYASPYYDPVKAHEYYMRTRELKGRHSTSGLNDKGREAASYVKNRLSTERKTKVERSKAAMKQKITASSALKKIQSDTRKKNRESFMKSANASLKSALSSMRNIKVASLKSIREKSKSNIKLNNEKTKKSIDTKRDQKNIKLERYKNTTNSKIDQLRQKLKNMSPAEKKKQSEKIQQEISELRESNKEQRNILNEDFKTQSETARTSNKAANEKIRSATKKDTAQVNANYKTGSAVKRRTTKASKDKENASYKKDQKSYSDAHKTRTKAYREEHKKNTKIYKNEYDNKYASELSKIRSDSGLIKVKKTRKRRR